VAGTALPEKTAERAMLSDTRMLTSVPNVLKERVELKLVCLCEGWESKCIYLTPKIVVTLVDNSPKIYLVCSSYNRWS
jgi:hypothetical protein